MLDYTKIQKKTFPVKLPNGITVLITMPKKKTFEKMTNISSADTENLTSETIDDIYAITAEILSCNMQKKNFTAEDVGEMFDIEDVVLLFNEYTGFVGGNISDPN